MLRMAQDYFACRFAFGDEPTVEVFEACRDKCLFWLKPHGDPKTWPTVSQIVAEMSTIKCGIMPTVAWVYNTTLSLIPMSGHVHWGRGNASKHEAYERNPGGITAERERVLGAFITLLRDKDWSVLFSLTLEDLGPGMALSAPPPQAPPQAPPLSGSSYVITPSAPPSSPPSSSIPHGSGSDVAFSPSRVAW